MYVSTNRILRFISINADSFDANLSCLPTFGCSFSLFYLFANIKIENKFINFFGKSMSDVYTLLAISLSDFDGTWWTYLFDTKKQLTMIL